MMLFWYAPGANFTTNTNVYVKTEQISTDLGYDFYKCTGSDSGDYFGSDINSLTKDTLWSGYNDG